MISLVALTLISLYVTAASAMPAMLEWRDNIENVDITGSESGTEQAVEPPNHSAKTWEIILVVVFSLVVIGILTTVVYVRVRHRRRKQEKRASGSVQSTSDLVISPSAKHTTTTTSKTVEDVIAPPLPTLPYSGLMNASRNPH